MTVICCATIPTMEAANKEVKSLQVELYGDWTFEQAQQWRDAGIDQAIFHQAATLYLQELLGLNLI